VGGVKMNISGATIWRMLRDGTQWQDLGAAHFERADARQTAHRLIRRLQQLGLKVKVVAA
jgi:hypothetical protein